jgi:muramidase (phage lysozyme)
MLQAVARWGTLTTEEERKQFMREFKEKGDRLKAERQLTGDAAKEARRRQQINEMIARTGLDQFIELIRGPITSAFEAVQRMLNQLAKQLAHFIKWMDGPDFTKLFETSDEVASIITKTQAELNDVTQDIQRTRQRAEQADTVTPANMAARQAELMTRIGSRTTEVSEMDKRHSELSKRLTQRDVSEFERKTINEELKALAQRRNVATHEIDLAKQDLEGLRGTEAPKKLKEQLDKEVRILEEKRAKKEKELNADRIRLINLKQKEGKVLTSEELRLLSEQQKVVRDSRMKALQDLIGSKEGGAGGYNAVNRRGGHEIGTENLSEMTVGELMKRQDAGQIFAAGRYQMIPTTLIEAMKAGKVKGDEKFTPEVQDRLFREYLLGTKRPEVSAFLTGRSNDVDAAVMAVAKEFAAVGVPFEIHNGKQIVPRGHSFYSGIGANRPGEAKISPDVMRDALIQASQKQAKFGGIFEGPAAGYRAPHRPDMTMHGREIVSPIRPDSILEKMAKTTGIAADTAIEKLIEPVAFPSPATASSNTALMELLSNKLDEVIRQLSDSVDIQGNIMRQSMV